MFDGIKRWLDRNQASTVEPHLYRYNAEAPNTPTQQHGRLPTPIMTSIGMLMRLYTGWKRDDEPMKDAARYLLKYPPAEGTANEPLRDTYYWYYATQFFFHMGGEDWRKWNGQLQPLLVESQVLEGKLKGSWEPLGNVPDAWGRFGGRLYVTTLNLLSLEVYYRHLPLYEATAVGKWSGLEALARYSAVSDGLVIDLAQSSTNLGWMNHEGREGLVLDSVDISNAPALTLRFGLLFEHVQRLGLSTQANQ